LQFGSNFLGPFALTMRLLPLVLAAQAPRVVTTVRPPRRARDTAIATRLWAEAERLTGTALPASAGRP
jgi:hypothetical protein